MKSERSAIMVTAAPLLLAILTGCTASISNGTNPSAESGNGRLYAVKSSHAAFYRYGPQQASGPDQRLPRDTILTVISASFGYCRVQLPSGEEGYVAKEDIHAAPPDLVKTLTEPAPVLAQTHGRKFRLDPNDPRLIAPPAPLPLDVPEPTPIPGTESSPGTP